jgi:rare lipoprotein A (peptidoglycan hydrolase)
MKRDSDAVGAFREGTGWKRFFILILSLLQSYFFIPTSGHNILSSQAAEAAEAPLPPTARSKRTRAKQMRQRSLEVHESTIKKVFRGKASWYGPDFHGKKMANGEVFDQSKFTAAHKTLPLGSKAIVTNLQNGNSVEVEINDRGPYVRERVIDVSYAAAKQLGFVESGTAPVRIELLPGGTG